MNNSYHRGDIFYADLGIGRGSEQSGYRPVVIIQNDIGNKYSSTVIVAAITTRIDHKNYLPTHCNIHSNRGLMEPSIILLEQIRTIDKIRLKRFVGRVGAEDLYDLDTALMISLNLTDYESTYTRLYLCNTCAESLLKTGAFDLIKNNSILQDHCSFCNCKPSIQYILTIKRSFKHENS